MNKSRHDKFLLCIGIKFAEAESLLEELRTHYITSDFARYVEIGCSIDKLHEAFDILKYGEE